VPGLNSFKGFKRISFLLILKQNHSVRFLKSNCTLDSNFSFSSSIVGVLLSYPLGVFMGAFHFDQPKFFFFQLELLQFIMKKAISL
jgi:hypothetical protein